MKLTIVTIAYNSAEVIGRTIESVLAQERGEEPFAIEYLIIDGASSDDRCCTCRGPICMWRIPLHWPAAI